MSSSGPAANGDPDKYVIDYGDTLHYKRSQNESYMAFGYDETASSISNITVRNDMATATTDTETMQELIQRLQEQLS